MHIILKNNLKSDYGYYYPLYNKKGLMSSITPRLTGDAKLDYHHYLLEPVTEHDLKNSLYGRNIIFLVDQKPFHLNGQTLAQKNDKYDLEAGLLYHQVTRKNKLHSIKVLSFIPLLDNIECHEVTYTNMTNHPQKISLLTATSLYGRSADNVRDHRHVTSLLNRITVKKNAIIVKPTLSFDERGHKLNEYEYAFISNTGLQPIAYYPTLDQFMGTGSYLYPNPENPSKESDSLDGYEAFGGIAYPEIIISPNESFTIYFGLAVDTNLDLNHLSKYLTQEGFHEALKSSQDYWLETVAKIEFNYSNEAKSNLLDMVALQPILRRFWGNSYMPHHDYGKGGKGWRDLWQDLLSLIMYNDPSVKEALKNNFAGIRIDGSNATIIGSNLGEFKADRNNIVRVWSDHGAWPLVTTLMYINETGDIDFLFEKMPYFDDQFTHYTYQTKQTIEKDHILKGENGIYLGTIFEHLLLENVVASLNLGKHGFIKLEDADWNDGLDMAKENGETLAFTHFYANNLRELAHILDKTQLVKVELNQELINLIKNLNQKDSLNHFLDQVSHFKGQVGSIESTLLIEILTKKSAQMIKHLKANSVMSNGGLQSYIDNDNHFLDNEHSLSLTGQAMALLSKTLTVSQAKKVSRITKQLLFSPSIGGYKLNTNYNELKLNMGRAYGFAYGHKENGAVFSHMAIMYAYGLYQYNMVKEGREAFNAILQQSLKETSGVLSGIPEYFTPSGIGKYAYLTGSASWLLKLLRTEVFGIQLELGKLTLEPKLMKQDFIDGVASISTYLFGVKRTITYYNPKGLQYGKYQIKTIKCNNQELILPTSEILGDLEVYLDETI